MIAQASSTSWTPVSIDSDQLTVFLTRQNSLLESLIQIYKQFLKMDASTSREGQAQLNKKLCVVESIKFYVEHLILFHKFNMFMAPSPMSSKSSEEEKDVVPTNYLSEMQINFKIIENRWMKRRQEQIEQINSLGGGASTTNTDDKSDDSDINYPFTFLIDCLFEECRGYANVAPFFGVGGQKPINESLSGYPPKSLIVSYN